jgi:hypothetical protein
MPASGLATHLMIQAPLLCLFSKSAINNAAVVTRQIHRSKGRLFLAKFEPYRWVLMSFVKT